MNSQDNQPIKI